MDRNPAGGLPPDVWAIQGLFEHEGMGQGLRHLPLLVEAFLVNCGRLEVHDT